MMETEKAERVALPRSDGSPAYLGAKRLLADRYELLELLNQNHGIQTYFAQDILSNGSRGIDSSAAKKKVIISFSPGRFR